MGKIEIERLENCPHCGAILDDLGRCIYCGSKVYDLFDIDVDNIYGIEGQKYIRIKTKYGIEILPIRMRTLEITHSLGSCSTMNLEFLILTNDMT